jgi:hypothetical protein
MTATTATMNETIQTQFRTIDGLSIRFAESEDRGDGALLLSPWPESLFAFEPMWAAAYRTKYRRYAKSITDCINSPGARSTTIKLVPRSSGP